jgi:hypothetical protein
MPRPYIPAALRRLVTERARGYCEYCLMHQDDSPDSHQIDHIIAVRHSGQTASENLALACAECNHFKGTDFATIDPASGAVVRLFNPRVQQWHEHFTLNGPQIVGLTLAGQITVELLRLNSEARLLEREVLIAEGRYPR